MISTATARPIAGEDMETDMGIEPDDEAPETETDEEFEEAAEGENPAQESDDGPVEEADEGEETIVSFDNSETSEEEVETSTIRHLRAELRASRKRLAEVERQHAAPKIEVGPRPTLAGCDYDEDAYARDLDAWFERRAQANRAEADTESAQRQHQEEWSQQVAAYQVAKSSLGVADADEAEKVVSDALDATQQSALIMAADNPALLIYSLAKHDGKLEALAKINNPIKFAAAVARLEGAMKVVKRRKAPAPEKIATGSAAPPASADKQLEKLEKDAERTGDRTKLIAYRKALKSKP